MIKMVCGLLIISLSLWASSFSDAREKAKAQQKPILVELVMESCLYCEKMEKFILSKEDVKKILEKNYILLKLDIHKDEIPEFLVSRVTPTFYFLSSDGITILHEVIGAPSKSEFIVLLDRYGINK